jgi:protein-tyrosine phosphatase
MGNICRSPMAEAILRTLAAQRAPALELEVDSAGTHDYHVGEPPDPRAVGVAAARGVDMTRLRARQLCANDFYRFDEILVMDRGNLAVTRSLAPERHRDRARLLLDDREVPDPYYGKTLEFERVFELLTGAAVELLDRLPKDQTAIRSGAGTQ